MAKDTIMLSPELCGLRREALADADLQTGCLVEYTATGVKLQAVAASAVPVLKLFAVENISTAEDVDYLYTTGENVHLKSAQAGALVNVRAVAATYNPGDLLETALAGELQAVTTGAPVAVVPSFGGEVITTGLLMVELI